MLLASLIILLFPSTVVHTQAGDFTLKLCPADKCYAVVPSLITRVRSSGVSEVRVVDVAAFTNCNEKKVMVSSGITRQQQAKAIVHEFVHVGMNCDTRETIGIDERVAQAVSDLFENNAVASFIQSVK